MANDELYGGTYIQRAPSKFFRAGLGFFTYLPVFLAAACAFALLLPVAAVMASSPDARSYCSAISFPVEVFELV
jgi:hypothetical protein